MFRKKYLPLSWKFEILHLRIYPNGDLLLHSLVFSLSLKNKDYLTEQNLSGGDWFFFFGNKKALSRRTTANWLATIRTWIKKIVSVLECVQSVQWDLNTLLIRSNNVASNHCSSMNLARCPQRIRITCFWDCRDSDRHTNIVLVIFFHQACLIGLGRQSKLLWSTETLQYGTEHVMKWRHFVVAVNADTECRGYTIKNVAQITWRRPFSLTLWYQRPFSRATFCRCPTFPFVLTVIKEWLLPAVQDCQRGHKGRKNCPVETASKSLSMD